MRKTMRAFLILAVVLAACSARSSVGAARGQRAHETTAVYADSRYGYQITYPKSWTLKERIPMYLSALKGLNPTAVLLQSPDQNAYLMAVAGPGARTPGQLGALEHDALTHMVQTKPFGTKDSRLTIHGVPYQLASTIGSWYDYGNHIAFADILALAASRRSSTYVFLTLVKLRTTTTSSGTTQLIAVTESLVVR